MANALKKRWCLCDETLRKAFGLPASAVGKCIAFSCWNDWRCEPDKFKKNDYTTRNDKYTSINFDSVPVPVMISMGANPKIDQTFFNLDDYLKSFSGYKNLKEIGYFPPTGTTVYRKESDGNYYQATIVNLNGYTLTCVQIKYPNGTYNFEDLSHLYILGTKKEQSENYSSTSSVVTTESQVIIVKHKHKKHKLVIL